MSRSLTTFPFPPTLRQRLLQCGFSSQIEIEEMSASALAKELSVPMTDAIQILKIVKGEQKPKSRSALEMLEEEQQKRPISIMSRNLDQLLGGGARIGEITEFCGVPGIGKTQIGMQIACVATAPDVLGGAFGGAVYIDTEGSFLAERVAEIASCLLPHIKGCEDMSREAASQLSQHILQNIYCYRLYDSTEQLACVKTLPLFLAAHRNVRVIIMDSVAFHFRRGFKDYSLRARLLTGLAQDLLKIGNDYDVAVVVMNQVTTKIGPRVENKDDSSLTPALGESWSHACTNRVMLYWDDHGARHAKILKSPSQKVADVVYYVTGTGVRDDADGKIFAPVPNPHVEETPEQIASNATFPTAIFGMDGQPTVRRTTPNPGQNRNPDTKTWTS